MVLEKDARGRPIKARSVKYELENVNPNAGIRKVKQQPGNQIVHYDYDSDGKPRITRQEEVK